MTKKLKLFIEPKCRECNVLITKLKIVKKDLFIEDFEIEYIDISEDLKQKEKYSITKTPTLILFNDENAIIWRHRGNVNYHELRHNIED